MASTVYEFESLHFYVLHLYSSHKPSSTSSSLSWPSKFSNNLGKHKASRNKSSNLHVIKVTFIFPIHSSKFLARRSRTNSITRAHTSTSPQHGLTAHDKWSTAIRLQEGITRLEMQINKPQKTRTNFAYRATFILKNCSSIRNATIFLTLFIPKSMSLITLWRWESVTSGNVRYFLPNFNYFDTFIEREFNFQIKR